MEMGTDFLRLTLNFAPHNADYVVQKTKWGHIRSRAISRPLVYWVVSRFSVTIAYGLCASRSGRRSAENR